MGHCAITVLGMGSGLFVSSSPVLTYMGVSDYFKIILSTSNCTCRLSDGVKAHAKPRGGIVAFKCKEMQSGNGTVPKVTPQRWCSTRGRGVMCGLTMKLH